MSVPRKSLRSCTPGRATFLTARVRALERPVPRTPHSLAELRRGDLSSKETKAESRQDAGATKNRREIPRPPERGRPQLFSARGDSRPGRATAGS
jgi:hypothetical protein